MFLLSDSVGLLKMFVQSTGNYFQNLLQTGTYSSSLVSDEWQGNWTVFYWSWWIAWSPFVGMFIARISKGRTLREFIFGVLLVPSLMTFLWMTVFGGSALNLEIETPGLLSSVILEDSSTSLFVLLHEYPLSSITSFIGIFMVSIFFITSSDSGSLVIDSITSGGKLDAPVGQRIMWALTEGLVATALLIGGGLKAMQAASVSSGILFLFVLLLMCWSLLKSLKRVRKRRIKKHRVKHPNAWIE
jgi:choline/glycine/proline betaine transport protein